ncbi:MAG TPA: hypothetical protein VLK84_13030 [Longimicrobium sp.]|nr:hypothetical protein [Longimicrobium sp.]
MTEPFIQPSARPWPSGDCTPVTHLDLEPAEIEDRLGIRFTPGSDDLGEFVEAAIQMASGRLLLFLRYTGSPAPGTTVLADARDDLRAAENDVNALLAL